MEENIFNRRVDRLFRSNNRFIRDERFEEEAQNEDQDSSSSEDEKSIENENINEIFDDDMNFKQEMIGLFENNQELITKAIKQWNIELSNLFPLTKNTFQTTILKRFSLYNQNEKKEKSNKSESRKVSNFIINPKIIF